MSGARINNRSARLLMNKWLADHGHTPISGDKSYEEFASDLRRVLAPTLRHAAFVDRAEACRYVRDMAHQRRHLTRKARAA